MRRLLPVLVAVVALAAPALARAADEGTLSVVGNGQVFVVPDVASVDVTVRKTLPTAVAARDSVSRRTRAVIAAARGLGVAAGDVQTTQISLRRIALRPLRKGGRTRVRFAASETVTLRLTDTDRVGPVLDAATKAGADSFDGPSFGFSDPSAGRSAAELAALADARKRADAAAASQGMRVTGVKLIQLDRVDGGPVPVSSESASTDATTSSGKGEATPVSPGRQEVDATVGVIFTIASAG